jgi:hypothetical protein
MPLSMVALKGNAPKQGYPSPKHRQKNPRETRHKKLTRKARAEQMLHRKTSYFAMLSIRP